MQAIQLTFEGHPYNPAMKTGRPSKLERTAFGARLHAAREAAGLSQAQVADKLDITQAAYAFWERRKYERRIPSLIRALFDRYGLMRVRRNGKQKFRVPPRNATLRDGKVYIIDFNGSKWRLPGEYPQSANPPPIPSKPP